MLNKDMEQHLRCSKKDLAMLKHKVETQMKRPIYDGKPLIGQRMEQFDPDGTHRKKLWDQVTSKKKYREMLEGKKWGKNKPKDFNKNVQKIQNKIVGDLNKQFRYSSNSSKTQGGSDEGEYQPGLDDIESEEDEPVSGIRRKSRGGQSSLPSAKASVLNTKPVSGSKMRTMDTFAGPTGASSLGMDGMDGMEGIEETRTAEKPSREGAPEHDQSDPSDFDFATDLQTMVRKEANATVSPEVEGQVKAQNAMLEDQMKQREERLVILEDQTKQREERLVGSVSAQVMGTISRGFQGLKKGP
ncbi:Hypothetical predicted protein [Lecanosticta acicola]|uniref:Uncharacterized protein n=1 Tax=Lecanosticta acicola TaxID=111012 RepID=A0AAI8YXK2_9PEZI|nr:Hypothetical predicted protein [Lecanosticta acicola]